MAVTITFQDIVNQTSDLIGNYTTSTIDLGNIQRAVNRAIEFVQRRLGLPSDRRIQSFYFYEDTPFYTLNSDYTEDIQLYYNTVSGNMNRNGNVPANRWNRVEDGEILRSTGQYQGINRYAFTTMNGSNQLLLNGHNLNQGVVVNTFDTLTGLTFSSSVTGAVIDNNIYKQGAGSLKFSLTTGEGTSAITIPGVQYDIRSMLNNNGAYRLYVFFPTSANTYFSSINVQLLSSTGNYYQSAATLDYVGSAWTSNGWSLLSFPLSTATTVGSPDGSAITSIVINFVHSGSFVNVSNMRIDYLYTVNPDYLDLVYYSAYKGTDITGATKKVLLNVATDILSFGSFAPDLIMPIALKAATIVAPQLRADMNFNSLYKQDFTETMLLWGKTYPRKRNSNAAASQLQRY